MTYYNEIDSFCCGVLRRRVSDGSLPHGHIDERSVQSVSPADLLHYRQLHLFAGIGGFGLASRLARLPSDFSLLTGGFPCQPFSVAGKRRGDSDDRFLWPDMLRLIRGVKPLWVLGENVPGLDDGKLVLDRVLTDLEESGYEGRAFEIPACGVDAPILRRRIWIVARRLASPEFPRLAVGESLSGDDGAELAASERGGDDVGGSLGLSNVGRCSKRRDGLNVWGMGRAPASRPGSLLHCADGKTRRVPGPESGIQLVASGIPQRMARLKAAGNAICPQVAAEIMKAMLASEGSAHD